METDMFLSTSELLALTGYKITSKQVEWLRRKGWRFELTRSNRPIVARKYAEKMLGCGVPEQTNYRPNFGALQGA